MKHQMTMKVYRKRPGEDPPRVSRAATVITIDPDDVTSRWLDDHYPAQWPACRCPNCRDHEGA
ncbi:hypothetical protein [Streptomyces zagrosensis]|uniref:Uncharacterized protein n=1 Tax=Streptomyces zagrosensis TaxID=1042984 RepID=A0A7W9V3P7_9ACTN|nr:hypothetical protein [Streptomyces zagrosensis]MBB5940139.1 hypothetical protein [Streptomyces zagrosensis]